MTDDTEYPKPRKKGVYIGAPACFALEQACQVLNEAFDGTCYLVGSALERPNWRDVDVRLIMDDEAFEREFPASKPVSHHRWEFDNKWLLMTISISERLHKLTGLPVDFQFQPRSHANARHKGPRNALGIKVKKPDPWYDYRLSAGALAYERVEELAERKGLSDEEHDELYVLSKLIAEMEAAKMEQ